MKHSQRFTDIIPGFVIEIRSYKKYDIHADPYTAHPVYRYHSFYLLQHSIYVPSPKNPKVSAVV